MSRAARRRQHRSDQRARRYASSGHAAHTTEVEVVQTELRPLVLKGGRAICRMPEQLGVPARQLVHVAIHPECGCAWAWVDDPEHLADGYEHHLAEAAAVPAMFDHTAMHHLLPTGFSLTHLPVPGHDD